MSAVPDDARVVEISVLAERRDDCPRVCLRVSAVLHHPRVAYVCKVWNSAGIRMNLTTKQALEVPPQLVLEVAYGIEDPKILAEKFGFSETEWDLLRVHDPFIKQVEAKKTELRASGYTFRMKAQMAAEDILDDVYRDAKKPDASFHTRLESLKFFAKAAGVEAPAKVEQSTGPAFSITINLGGGQSIKIGTAAQDVVDVEEEPEDPYGLPEVPHHLRAADLHLNMEVCE